MVIRIGWTNGNWNGLTVIHKIFQYPINEEFCSSSQVMQRDRATLACASQGYETLKNGSTMAQYVSYVQTPEACMIHLKGKCYMNGLRTSRNLPLKLNSACFAVTRVTALRTTHFKINFTLRYLLWINLLLWGNSQDTQKVNFHRESLEKWQIFTRVLS